jgi:hypothetical protein
VLDGGLRDRCAAQIGVQNHACGVNNGPQRRREHVRHLIGYLHPNGPRFWHGARKIPRNIVTNPLQDGSSGIGNKIAADPRGKFRKRRHGKELVDGGNLSQKFAARIAGGIGCGTHRGISA